MKTARPPDNEEERIAALAAFEILDTQSEPQFDDLAWLAANICQTPIALVSLVDPARQWFKAKIGIDACETPRDWAFCAHALHEEDMLIVSDTLQDERFVDNPLVTSDPKIRFYAGVPLRTKAGYALGTLCVIDRKPRDLDPVHLQVLRVLAKQVMNQIESHHQSREKSKVILAGQKAEEKFRLVVEAAPSGMVMIDHEGTIVLVNSLLSQQFGYPGNTLLGQSIESLIPERFRQHHPDKRSAFFAAPEPRSMGSGRDLFGLRQDGSEFPVEIGLNPLTTDEGTFVLASVIDISERQRMQRESEEKFKNLINSNLILMWTCSLDGACDFLNDQWLSYTGLPAQEQLGYGWLEQVHPGDREATQQAWQQAVTEEKPLRTEFRIRRHDGHYRWFLTLANPLRNDQGHLFKWVGCNIDVTERRQTEARLQFAHSQNELLLNSVGDGIYGLDLEGNTTFVNPTAAKMLGYDPAELLGKPIHLTIHHSKPDGSPYPQEDCPTYKAIRDGSVHQIDDEVLWRRDGTSFPIEYTSTPIHEVDGTITGAVVTFRNITDRRNAEDELEIYIDDLRRSNAELEQFAYVASHDLQEPLRKIRNFSDLLESKAKGHLPPEAEKYLTPIVNGAMRMQTLVQDLLTYSKVSRGELKVETIDLQEIALHVKSTLNTVITECQATVTIGPLPTLEANPLQMEQLLQNLIGNGLKYRGPDMPVIDVSAIKKQEHWEFAVRDNGIGLDLIYAQQIFVIFQRLHTKKDYAGTGIGLAICKKIVELHGGEIWVESTVNEGSTFFFTLPHTSRQDHQSRSRRPRREKSSAL